MRKPLKLMTFSIYFAKNCNKFDILSIISCRERLKISRRALSEENDEIEDFLKVFNNYINYKFLDVRQSV